MTNFGTATAGATSGSIMWNSNPSPATFDNFTSLTIATTNADGNGAAFYMSARAGATTPIHHCVITNCAASASRQRGCVGMPSGLSGLELTRLIEVIFVDQTTDFCARIDRGELRLEYCSFLRCTLYFRQPLPADNHGGYVVLSHCRFNSGMPPVRRWIKYLDEQEVMQPITDVFVCVEEALARSCPVRTTCGPFAPAATIAATAMPGRSLPGCVNQYTGARGKIEANTATQYCCVDVTFAHLTDFGGSAKGGACYVQATATFTCDECTFTHLNIGQHAGMVYVASANILRLSNCCGNSLWAVSTAGCVRFDSAAQVRVRGFSGYLSACGTDGGVFYIYAVMDAKFEFCNFTECDSATFSAGGGGVFYDRAPAVVEGAQQHLVMKACGSSGLQVGGGIKQYLGGATMTGTSVWLDIVFVDIPSDFCAFAEISGTISLQRCRFRGCLNHFRVTGTARVLVSDSVFDGGIPVNVETSIVLTNCEGNQNPDAYVTCFFFYSRITECTVLVPCPTQSGGETPAPTARETATESKIETVFETNSESNSESRAETATESGTESQRETAKESPKSSPRASDRQSALATPIRTLLASVSAEPVSSQESAAGKKSGSSGLAWGVGIVVGLLVGALIAFLLVCFVCGPSKARHDSDKVEAEKSGEADASAVEAPPATEPQAATKSRKEELPDQTAPRSDSEHASSGAPKPEADVFAPEEGSDAGARKRKAKPHKGKAPARGHGVAGIPKDAPESDLRVVTCDPLSIAAAVGSRSSASVPFEEQIWTRVAYRASFSPPQESLRVSSDRGWIEPGSAEFPFKLFFEPSSGGPVETVLIVNCGTFETHTQILASTGEEAPKKRRKHAK